MISDFVINLTNSTAKSISFINKKNTTKIITKTVIFGLDLNKTNTF